MDPVKSSSDFLLSLNLTNGLPNSNPSNNATSNVAKNSFQKPLETGEPVNHLPAKTISQILNSNKNVSAAVSSLKINTVVPNATENGDFRLFSNNLKNQEFGKNLPQNFYLERATIANRQGAKEDKNFGVKTTSPKTDSSNCFSIDQSQPIVPTTRVSANDFLTQYGVPESFEQPLPPKEGSPPKETREDGQALEDTIFQIALWHRKKKMLPSALVAINRIIWLMPRSERLYITRIEIQLELIRNNLKWIIYSTIDRDVDYLIREHNYSDLKKKYLYLISAIAALYDEKLVAAQEICEKSRNLWFPIKKEAPNLAKKIEESEQQLAQDKFYDKSIGNEIDDSYLGDENFEVIPIPNFSVTVAELERIIERKKKMGERLREVDQLINSSDFSKALEILFFLLENEPNSDVVYEKIISIYLSLAQEAKAFQPELFFYIGWRHLFRNEKIPALNYLLLSLDSMKRFYIPFYIPTD